MSKTIHIPAQPGISTRRYALLGKGDAPLITIDAVCWDSAKRGIERWLNDGIQIDGRRLRPVSD